MTQPNNDYEETSSRWRFHNAKASLFKGFGELYNSTLFINLFREGSNGMDLFISSILFPTVVFSISYCFWFLWMKKHITFQQSKIEKSDPGWVCWYHALSSCTPDLVQGRTQIHTWVSINVLNWHTTESFRFLKPWQKLNYQNLQVAFSSRAEPWFWSLIGLSSNTSEFRLAWSRA